MRCSPTLLLGSLIVCLFGCVPPTTVTSDSGAANTTVSQDRGDLSGDNVEPPVVESPVFEPPATEELEPERIDEVERSTVDGLSEDAAASTVNASDAEPVEEIPSRPAWTTSRIHSSPDPPLPFEVEEAFGGLCFYAPVFIHQIPGTEQYLIGELCGRIYSIDENAPNDDPVLAIDLYPDAAYRPPAPARGQPPVVTDNPMPAEQLYDLIFHPDFESNRQVFLTYTAPQDQVAWVSRMELTTDNPPLIQRDSETRLFSWSATGHNGGCVRFGPDGYLYISTGDGVGPNPPDSNDVGQDISNLLASVLRIDVDNPTGDQPYAIPADNPFIDTPGAKPEVWAYGFRNPWKMDFDGASGKLWVADVGWETWEMVHLVSSGGNYGWPIMEGRKPLRSEVQPGPTPITPPVKDYTRADGNSVTGGIVYSGTKYPELAGWFIHGDYRTGHIWGIKMDEDGVPQHQHLARSSICIVAFMETANGDIYVMDHDRSGKTFRLVPSEQGIDAHVFPENLAATGLFTNTAELQPAPGVIPYVVTAAPWMDGAMAERLLALPGDSKIATSDANGQPHWEFPAGTVLAQTVFHNGGVGPDPVRLETRILHLENDNWHGYSYRWNEAQTDAVLVSSAGEQFDLRQQAADSQVAQATNHDTWRIVSRAECMFCHRQRIGSVLGFTPSQLNRQVSFGRGQRSQLDVFAAMGVFEGDPAAAIDEAASLVDPHDSLYNLTDRARSYLDVNCGICHSPQGESITMFYLRRHYSLEDAKAFNKVSIGTFGMQDPHLIVPGDPYGSIILYRIGKLGNARMPYVGSRVVDPAGFVLIHDWIASMDGEASSLSADDRLTLETLGRADASADERTAAVSQLLGSTSGALALLSMVRVEEVSAQFQDQIVGLSQQSPAATVRSLFEDFIPESQRRPTLGDNIQPELILDLEGDAARGKLIYLSDSSRCRICHTPDQQGRALGADLKEIGKKYPKPELLRHIIEPSLKMEPTHTPYLVETESGEVVSGLIVERNEEEIVLRDARLETIRVATDEIETMEPLTKSIMPERLLGDMTAQEAADLLEYLSTLRGDE